MASFYVINNLRIGGFFKYLLESDETEPCTITYCPEKTSAYWFSSREEALDLVHKVGMTDFRIETL